MMSNMLFLDSRLRVSCSYLRTTIDLAVGNYCYWTKSGQPGMQDFVHQELFRCLCSNQSQNTEAKTDLEAQVGSVCFASCMPMSIPIQ